jgi:pyruvate,water dikinase
VPTASWDPPAHGVYSRTLRFGEWISEPVTPLFETWLLSRLEERFHAGLRDEIGQVVPRPYHVVVNGWYYYTLNWLAPSAWARSLPTMLARVMRNPRVIAGIVPPLVRHAVPPLERQWRGTVQPRYRAATARAAGDVETLRAEELPGLIDELADRAGEYFLWIASLGGTAYKMEINLARFYRRHLREAVGPSHLPLLAGLEPPTDPQRHAVVSLDWWHPARPEGATATTSTADHRRLVEAREAAENAAFDALAGSPRRLRTFRSLLAETQRLIPIREEQAREWTITWPVMRRAVVRIGETLAARGRIRAPEDAFFLTRAEVLGALDGRPAPAVDVDGRRSLRDGQAALAAPLLVGRLSRPLQRFWDAYPRMFGAARSEQAIVSGWPASPGRASGVVRVVRGPDEFDTLRAGEILAAPLTTPAWTPLFTLAAGIVTDVGSSASHASIVAREYGIPAVVGTGYATSRLRTGMRVTVDGTTGNVELA